MTNFVIPKRFDEASATNGKLVEVYDEMGNDWGTFRVQLSDKTLPRYRLAWEAIDRKYGISRNKNKPVPDVANAEFFVDLALLGWELKDVDGNEIPYSRALAIEYFSRPDTKFALNYLDVFATDVKNFQPDEQDELPEKNSLPA